MFDFENDFDLLFEELIQEGKKTSVTRISRQTKIKKATSQLASIEGRKKNDPLYNKMIFYKEKYFHYRELLHKKYSPRVRSKARK